MLSLVSSVQAFQAPASVARATRSSAVSMFEEGDIGVLPPLGVWDPLGLIETRDMRRYTIMEIKHGRGARVPPALCPTGTGPCPHARFPGERGTTACVHLPCV